MNTIGVEPKLRKSQNKMHTCARNRGTSNLATLFHCSSSACEFIRKETHIESAASEWKYTIE